jgi:hypothetical protein
VPARTIQADAGCPVEIIELGTPAPPATITVVDRSGSQSAPLGVRPDGLPRYRLDRPTDGPFTIRTPTGTKIDASVDDRSPAVGFEGAAGDPVIRLYCSRRDATAADATAFGEMFTPQHLHVSLDEVRHFPDLLVGAAGAATVVTFGWASVATVDDLRRRRRAGAAGTLPAS